MYQRHRLRSLIEIDPITARRLILEEYRKAGCHKINTAVALQCNPHTLLRWVRALGMVGVMQELEESAAREGWHHGRRGGGGFHRDVERRVRRSRATRIRNGSGSGA